MPKFLTLLLALKLITFKAYAQQCTSSYASTSGYTVTIKIQLMSVIANPASSCPYGYNYNVALNYTITYAGTPPSNLYVLQGNVTCNGNQSLFFNLPTNGSNSNGSYTTGTNPYISSDGTNVYTTHPSCNAANVSNLNCGNVTIHINGPGIADQTTSCNNNSTLPISLSYFTAVKNKEGVFLKWQTETEKNNEFFEIEKSMNGQDWTSVAKIKGAGTTSKLQNYAFTDDNLELGIIYYRLRQSDYDRTATYSPVIYVLNTGADIFCSNIWPNPANDKFSFLINAPANGKATYNLLSDVGQVIQGGSVDFYTGQSEISLSSADLPAGFYLLEIVFDSTHKVYRKMVKQ